jgi:hypothetical protein
MSIAHGMSIFTNIIYLMFPIWCWNEPGKLAGKKISNGNDWGPASRYKSDWFGCLPNNIMLTLI